MADAPAPPPVPPLQIAGEELASRLILGTGGFHRLDELAAAIEVSGTSMVTVAMRRVEPTQQGSLISVLDRAGVRVLPTPPAASPHARPSAPLSLPARRCRPTG